MALDIIPQRQPAMDEASSSPSFEAIIKLHREGIVSKSEARSLALGLIPEKKQNAPRTPPHQIKKRKWKPERYQSRAPSPSDIASEIHGHVGSELHFAPPPRPQKKPAPGFVRPPKKKGRPGRASPQTAKIRHLVKDSTRRRFFCECVKQDSVLWTTNKTGKQVLNKLLFSRAAQDPMEECYRLNPGPLYSVTGSKLLNIIKWRVNKDRQNWLGKTPKRQVVFGPESPFNWEDNDAELKRLDYERWGDAGEPLTTRSSSNSSAFSSSSDSSAFTPSDPSAFTPTTTGDSDSCTSATNSADDCQAKPKKCADASPLCATTPPLVKRKKIAIDSLGSCLTCGVVVWIGAPDNVVPQIGLGFPLDADWTQGTIEPYCEKC